MVYIDGHSGYVALAVASVAGVRVKEVETGVGDREKNMVAFATEALQLLKEVIQTGTSDNL